MNDSYTRLLQRRIGSTAVSASTARGMGPPGTIAAARRYLAEVQLREFEVDTSVEFMKALDSSTEQLRRALPEGARHWGSARKFLNIFLRGCAYNRHICDRYRLAVVEEWLELPLDSHVVGGLRDQDGRMDLPKWGTVIGLKRKVSDLYQTAAAEVAAAHGVYRVHLDLQYWRAKDA